MFIDAALVTRIDRAEAALGRAIAASLGADGPAQVVPVAGGAGVLVRPGSPMNKVIGLPHEGPLDERALADVEAAWGRVGEPVRIELSTRAAPEVLAALVARGYQLCAVEDVLVRRLPAPAPAAVPDIVVTRARSEAEVAAWRAAILDGFLAGDGTGAAPPGEGRAVLETMMRDIAAAPGFERYVAHRGGQLAGAASLRLEEGVALMCGAATLPAHRRRGVQAAMLAARLRDAHAAGAEVAVVTTAPGSLSEHNVVRSGFALGFARLVLVLDPPPTGVRAELSPAVLAPRVALPVRPTPVALRGPTVELLPLDLERDVDDLHAVSCGAPCSLGAMAQPAYDADARIWRWMHGGPFADAAGLRAWLAASMAAPDRQVLVVRERSSGRPLGAAALMASHPADLRIELGSIWFSPLAQGTGMVREAITLMIDHVVALGYQRVEWKCDARNERSRRAARSYGFTFEGVQPAHMIVKGERRDTAWFHLLATTWAGRRAG